RHHDRPGSVLFASGEKQNVSLVVPPDGLCTDLVGLPISGGLERFVHVSHARKPTMKLPEVPLVLVAITKLELFGMERLLSVWNGLVLEVLSAGVHAVPRRAEGSDREANVETVFTGALQILGDCVLRAHIENWTHELGARRIVEPTEIAGQLL